MSEVVYYICLRCGHSQPRDRDASELPLTCPGNSEDKAGCDRKADETAFDWATVPLTAQACLGAIFARAYYNVANRINSEWMC